MAGLTACNEKCEHWTWSSALRTTVSTAAAWRGSIHLPATYRDYSRHHKSRVIEQHGLLVFSPMFLMLLVTETLSSLFPFQKHTCSKPTVHRDPCEWMDYGSSLLFINEARQNVTGYHDVTVCCISMCVGRCLSVSHRMSTQLLWGIQANKIHVSRDAVVISTAEIWPSTIKTNLHCIYSKIPIDPLSLP